MLNCGVYMLYSIATGKVYIGSSANLKHRRTMHYWFLRKGSKKNRKLLEEYNLYGNDNLVFCVLLYCDKENLKLYEQMCIDVFECELNMAPSAYSLKGIKRSAEFVDTLRNNVKEYYKTHKHVFYGTKLSEEYRKKISNSRKGFHMSDEQKEKLRIINTGRKLSEETKRKMHKKHVVHKIED